MKKYERVKALVSLDAIAHNFEEMHKNVKEGTKIIAVIKADGYGHGARAIARLIQDYDYIWGFATATAEEALELRHAGITKPVLILGLVFEEYYEELAANDIRITISDLNTAAEYAKAGARIGKKCTYSSGSGYGNDKDRICGYSGKCGKDRKNLKNPESGDRGNVYSFCQGG